MVLQHLSATTRVGITTPCVIVTLASLPNLALAADGDSGGIPIWVYPAGLLIVALIFKFVQGDNEAAANKRRTAAQRKKRTAARQRAEERKTYAQSATTSSTPTPPETIVANAAERKTVIETPIKDSLEDAQDYINRERYPEANIILKCALQQTPDRVDLQLKLLEVYALQHDEQAFELQYQIIVNLHQPDSLLVADNLRAVLHQQVPQQTQQHAPLETGMSAQGTSAGLLPTLTTTVETNSNKLTMASLEAEFGFHQQAVEPSVKPNEPTENTQLPVVSPLLDFDLGDFKATPLKMTDRFASANNVAATPTDEHAGNVMNFEAIAPYTPAAPLEEVEPLWPNTLSLAAPVTEKEPETVPHIAQAQHSLAETTPLNDALLQGFPALSTLDIQQTNLELAENYVRLGEKREACELLKEVLYHGSAQQKVLAQSLMDKIIEQSAARYVS